MFKMRKICHLNTLINKYNNSKYNLNDIRQKIKKIGKVVLKLQKSPINKRF